MILPILITLLTFQALPGDVVNLSITDYATLTASDNCMYFIDSLQTSINVTPGEYGLKIGINCSKGLKEVYANGEVLAQIEVGETEIDYQSYAAQLEKENLGLKMLVKSLKDELKDAEKKVEELNSQLEELQNQAKILQIQNELQKQQIEDLKKKLEEVNSELQDKINVLEKLREEIKELNRQSIIYKLATLFVVSLFVGSFVALVFVSRRE